MAIDQYWTRPSPVSVTVWDGTNTEEVRELIGKDKDGIYFYDELNRRWLGIPRGFYVVRYEGGDIRVFSPIAFQQGFTNYE